MIEEFAQEKAVLSLGPRSDHEGGGHIPNVDVAERFGGEGHVGVDEILDAHCCANRGGFARFDYLFWCEWSDEQWRVDWDPSVQHPECAGMLRTSGQVWVLLSVRPQRLLRDSLRGTVQ